MSVVVLNFISPTTTGCLLCDTYVLSSRNVDYKYAQFTLIWHSLPRLALTFLDNGSTLKNPYPMYTMMWNGWVFICILCVIHHSKFQQWHSFWNCVIGSFMMNCSTMVCLVTHLWHWMFVPYQTNHIPLTLTLSALSICMLHNVVEEKTEVMRILK